MRSRSFALYCFELYDSTEKSGQKNKNSVTFMLYNFTKIK